MLLKSLPASCRRTNSNITRNDNTCSTPVHYKTFLQSTPRRQRALVCVCAGAAPDPYTLLQVPRGASRKEIRAAYIEQIRTLHPDVCDREDATQVAAALNAAYAALMVNVDNVDDDDQPLLDEFDQCLEPPTCVFINPFATNANPLLWQELQAVAAGAEDPLEALRGAGVAASEAAVCYLTRAQVQALEEELTRMCGSWAFDAAAYYVSDCLARARVVNNRVGGPR